MRSTMIDIESSSLIPSTIECKYCRWSMVRSCSSSALLAINHASSRVLEEYASITMAESSPPTPTIIDCNRSLTGAITSHPSIVAPRSHMGSCIRRASRSHRLLGRPSSACDWSQSMACRHVHMAPRSSSICTIMDEASHLDDDDDSIAGR